MIRRRLDLRSLIVGMVTAMALAGALSLIGLLTLSSSRQARFDEQVLRALQDERVAASIRSEISRQLDIARAAAASPNPLLAAQFEAAGTRVHEQLRFYLFRELSGEERRLVERIREAHARLELEEQRVFVGAPFELDAGAAAALTRDVDMFVAQRQAWRAGIGERRRELARGLLAAAISIGLLFLSAVLLLLGVLQRRLLDRLAVLGRAATAVGSGDFSVRVPLLHDDELTDLGAAFNRMVSERERATLDLKVSEERYRSLFDGVPIGLYRSTPDGYFLDVNDVCASLLGYSDKTQLLARPVPLPSHDRADWMRAMAATEGSHQVTWWLERPDGRTVWIRDTAHAVRDADGRVLRYEGALEDVTDRVLAKRALERSEARFRSLIENGSEAIVVLDSQAVVRYQSPSVQRMLGYGNDASVRDNPLALVHPDDMPAVLGALGQLTSAEHQRSDAIEFRCRHESGEWRVLRAVGTSMLHDPHVNGVVINVQDVTEQRGLEQKYLQAQKMEAVGRLAGGIAHDFNNLLTAIGGYAELLVSEAGEQGPSPELHEIRHAVERAAALTRQLLAFSRQQVVQPRALNLSSVAANIRDLLQRLIGEDVELVTHLAADAWVMADRGQMEQVLVNFVVNSRDAMPDGGAITIATCLVELAEGRHGLAAGRYAELSVSDTGQGMSPEVLARAFDPFFTTKEVGKGTGLGLATVYGIAIQAGGTVVAESVAGTGSRFSVLLPLIDAPGTGEGTPQVHPPADRGRERILLVEDEPAVRGLAERVLQRQGHVVVSAANGRMALELLDRAEQPFDLVVTDVVMPDLGGPDLIERVRETYPGMRVLFMSGYARESFSGRPLLSGSAVNFLEKPFTPQQFARAVRDVLDQDFVVA